VDPPHCREKLRIYMRSTESQRLKRHDHQAQAYLRLGPLKSVGAVVLDCGCALACFVAKCLSW